MEKPAMVYLAQSIVLFKLSLLSYSCRQGYYFSQIWLDEPSIWIHE